LLWSGVIFFDPDPDPDPDPDSDFERADVGRRDVVPSDKWVGYFCSIN